MCAPEAPCFEAWEGGLEADFGPKPIFIKIRFFQGLGGLWTTIGKIPGILGTYKGKFLASSEHTHSQDASWE